MANGDGRDWTSLKAWANAVGVVGIPGAIAFFLVYMGATYIPKMVSNMDVINVELQHSREVLREHIAQTDRLIRIIQRTCSNAAKDETARQRCFD